jgi:hypothetical protein
MGLLASLLPSLFGPVQQVPAGFKSCRFCWYSQYLGKVCQATNPPTAIVTGVFNAQNCGRYSVEAPQTPVSAAVDAVTAAVEANKASTDDVTTALATTNAKLDSVKASADATKTAVDTKVFLVTVIPSDVLLASSDAQVEITSSQPSMQKIKEFQISANGKYRIKCDAKSAYGSQGTNVQVYKNGVAYGTLQGTVTGSWETLSLGDLAFSVNDLCQLYAQYNGVAPGTYHYYVANFRLFGDLSSAAAVEKTV